MDRTPFDAKFELLVLFGSGGLLIVIIGTIKFKQRPVVMFNQSSNIALLVTIVTRS